ncbi:hypothetical protein [Bradyrhizobium uaiense]|uniref:Uncharacterized protein n=1 Tax=Bradyrhizobium uaiense TaxID=2594946 RepID=A0A6P1BGF1_9BRAD|nr:hypothetical protein [Bradyrhizobium uaiense]NEU97537.1 hypothetical protein [Bradyrhizobium uaiense]
MAVRDANAKMNKANAARALKAKQTHCKQGHPLSGDNLRIERDSKTGAPRRACRACRNASYQRGSYKYTAEQVETATDCIMNKGMTIAEVTQRRGDRARIIKFEALAIALSKDPALNNVVRQLLHSMPTRNCGHGKERGSQNLLVTCQHQKLLR